MPRDAETNAFLTERAKWKNRKVNLWIGLRVRQGRFEWVDGTALEKPMGSWIQRQLPPFKPASPCCVYITNGRNSYHGPRGGWTCASCTHPRLFACQVDPGST
ncbi:uncharacterized protein LOC144867357 [Branchiostoma floridae x Branchiostoma japonicum]